MTMIDNGNPQTITPGIHRDFPTDRYFEDPCPEPSLSQSIAKIILDQSVRHAYCAHPRLGKKPEQRDHSNYVQAIGNAAHALLLGRSRDLVVIEHKNYTTKIAQEARDQALDAGKLPILDKHYRTAQLMAEAARAQLAENNDAFDAFLPGTGDAEVMIVAVDEHPGEDKDHWFRSLVDWLHTDLLTIDDYKTTGANIAPHVLGMKAQQDGWHVQAAMQEFILDRIHPDGAGRRRFRFIAQEQYEPYALTVFQMSENWMTMGRKQLNIAIDKWTRALVHDRWPAYEPRVYQPEYPGWAERQWLEREEREHFERNPFRNDGVRSIEYGKINGAVPGSDHFMGG